MTAYTTPIYLKSNEARQLERVPFGRDKGPYDEAWLQQILFTHPQSIPIGEIAPAVSELIPICTELSTPAGPADILYVTPQGQVVLVETKLWSNSQARREVVVQILDYAKELVAWTFDDLSSAAAKAMKSGSLLERVKQRSPSLDESRFIDSVNRCLKTGDLVLLVIGDGIRTGAENLVSFVEQYGSLRFTLGLIEVAAYQLDGGVFLQPRVLAKTEIIRIRTIALPQLPGGPALDGEEEPEETPGDPVETKHREFHLQFWADFLSRLALQDSNQPKPSRPSPSTNLFFPQPPSGHSCWISAWSSSWTSKGGVYLTWTKGYSAAKDAFALLESQREEIEREIGQTLDWVEKNGRFSIGTGSRSFGDLQKSEDRESALAYLLDTTNRFVNAFRFRLDAFERQRAGS